MAEDRSANRPFADVRMRGFACRTTVQQALAWLDRQLACLPAEQVPLAGVAWRVLAQDVVSQVDVPAFARAMMDGFAVRAGETLGASAYNRLPLSVVGDSFPGRPFAGTVTRGQVVRIMTGAPLPPGADAVLPVEKTETDGPRVLALSDVSPGRHVGRVGEDITSGSTVLAAGRRLRPQDLGVLSSIGMAEVPVVRQPRVRVIATGNELLPAGSAPQPYRTVDANTPVLEALVRRDGGLAHSEAIVPDDPDAVRAALLSDADLVVVSGGTSVGQEDHVPRLVAEQGELAVHGIAMRPSGPVGLGRLGQRLVFLLPGNPVACLCGYDFFAGRAIRVLAGRSHQWPYRKIRAPLRRKLVSAVGRLDYARVRLRDRQVEPLAITGASNLTSTTRADGFVVVPDDSEGYGLGAEVDVYLYD